MLTHNITKSITDLLSSPINILSNGHGIYHLLQHSHISQGDESSLDTWILSCIPPNNSTTECDDEFCNREPVIYGYLRDMITNNLTPLGMDKQDISVADIWISGYRDMLTFRETDNTIYITFIQSGQY